MLVNQRYKKKMEIVKKTFGLHGELDERQKKLNAKFKHIKKNISELNETVQICYFASRYGLKYKSILADIQEEAKNSSSN